MKRTGIILGLAAFHQITYYVLALFAFGIGMGSFTDSSAAGKANGIISIMGAWNLPQILFSHYTNPAMVNRDLWTELPMYISATTPIGIIWSFTLATAVYFIWTKTNKSRTRRCIQRPSGVAELGR
jgi:hypothetical protein